jgi:hypothetical protein
VLELDGRVRTYTAEEWNRLCCELKGIGVSEQFEVFGDCFFKRITGVADGGGECVMKDGSASNNSDSDARV